MNKAEQDELDYAYLNAANTGDAAEVARCLKAGAEMYRSNFSNGWDAMNYALNGNHAGTVRTLVEQGYNPNRGADHEHGGPVLCWALAPRLKEAVEELVRMGADVSLKNLGNKPPLVFCLEKNNAFGISFLLQSGADPEPAIAYLNHTSDIKWSSGAPTKATVAHFEKELAARRRSDEEKLLAQREREGRACEDAMSQGSAAVVTPLKPLKLKI